MLCRMRYLTLISLALTTSLAGAKVSVVATTTDLADWARTIGGDRADVYGIVKPGEDPHYTRPTPGQQRRLSTAKLFLQTGLDLETWAPRLIEGARNPGLVIQTCSRGIRPLEVRRGASPGEGDVHPSGNPHVFLDPANARIGVSNVLAGLIAVDEANKDYYRERARSYLTRLDQKIAAWEKRLRPHRGAKVVAYHNSWPYWAQRFGTVFIGFIEPRPGIPPSARDLADLVNAMKRQGVKVVITESFYPRGNAESVARQAGATLINLATYPGSEPDTDTYLAMMDYNVETLAKALE